MHCLYFYGVEVERMDKGTVMKDDSRGIGLKVNTGASAKGKGDELMGRWCNINKSSATKGW